MISPIRPAILLIMIAGIVLLSTLLPKDIYIKLPNGETTDTLLTVSTPRPVEMIPKERKADKKVKSLSETYLDNRKNTKDNHKESKTHHTKSGKKQPRYKKFLPPDTLKVNKELRIQYPKKNPKVLYSFFKAIADLEKNDELIRVIHFGDSQLEGDRITAFLREKFQETFGGCGVGIAHVVDKLNSKLSIGQKADNAWQKYGILNINKREQGNSYFGILGAYYKFWVNPNTSYHHTQTHNYAQLASYTNTKKRKKLLWTKAGFSYIKSQYASPIQQKVENLKILYRNPKGPFEIQIQELGQPLFKKEIETNEEFDFLEYPLEGDFQQVQISIGTGKASPEVYGVALDCNKGITFDNVALRGSSGIEFTRINKEHLKNQIKKMNVKCIILQFGVNVTSNPVKDYTFYEKMYYEQLKFLKSLAPNLSVLVISVSDRSRNVGGSYVSYPNIEKIRNAQRNAAFKAGCAFWDLYEAMGGKDSMASWVFNKPPLATKDFIHFTAKGADLVSEMLYKALLAEYDKYYELHR